ncbi:hypothetical protein HYT25_02815 [Candidatus Pacearchaeota archaeon]|nr:hypothetical protein [Candidatus Pacearchaeota archaeon]
MAEIKIKIPDEIRERMQKESINISVLIERLIKHLEEEKEMIDWSVKLQRASRKGRFDELKKRGLI